MERQPTMRVQASAKKNLAGAPASFTASRRGESTRSLAPDDRKRTAATLDAVDAGEVTAAGQLPFDDLTELYGGGAGAVSGTKKFDLLESLGPSLLEVLTLVRPPQPQWQQQQHDQQDAGEDAGGEVSASASYEQLHDVPPPIDPRAKFDVCLSRSAVVARVVDASVDNTRQVQEFFARTLEKLKCEATGLVLLQDATVVMFIETTADEFLQICEQLGASQQAVLDRASTKVLASCDDNAVRLLQGLYFRKITLTRAAADAGEWTDDSLRQVCVDTFMNLVKFAKKIGPMPPAEIRKVLNNLANSDQILLPSNELLLWLLAREDVMPLDEFLDVYNSPIALELESERVWPVHPLISY